MKKNRVKTILIIVMLSIIGTFGVATLAKFIIEEYHSYFMNANNFYFTSNRLKKNGATYLVNNWSGVGSFNISFNLLSEKNRYVYSPYDIPYEVSYTCPNDVTCSLDKQSGTIYSSSTSHSDTVTLSVTPSRAYNEGEMLSIVVNANSTSPYIESLSGTFQYVVGKQGVTYAIEDSPNQVYLLFKITNAITFCRVNTAFLDYSVGDLIDIHDYKLLSAENKAKCTGKKVDLTFNPNILLLDTTDNIINNSTYTSTTISGVDYINSLSFSIEPVSTTAIKFYKINTLNDYTYPYNNNSSIINVSIHD